MEKKAIVFTAFVFAVLIFSSGCTTTESPPDTYATPVQTEDIIVTAEPTYAVTDPVLVIGEDIYSIKITTDAKKIAGNALYVAVHYDSSTTFSSTGVGSELMATIFAYNYNDVPYDFDPKTTDDVINAGIPYKRVPSVVYPNNKVNAATELPTDSVQGGLNIANPYNYGAIIEKTGTRN